MMQMLFIIFYVIANELTYIIALRQQMGLCRFISAGDLCWANRIILAVLCIWYCGWIVGIVLIVFSLFGLLHATIGWILTIPTLFTVDERKLRRVTDMECGLLIPLDILWLVFAVLSFFLTSYKSLLPFIGTSTAIIVIAAVLVIGFLIRAVISRYF